MQTFFLGVSEGKSAHLISANTGCVGITDHLQTLKLVLQKERQGLVHKGKIWFQPPECRKKKRFIL
jgi:hypothetical protein